MKWQRGHVLSGKTIINLLNVRFVAADKTDRGRQVGSLCSVVSFLFFLPPNRPSRWLFARKSGHSGINVLILPGGVSGRSLPVVILEGNL